MTSALAILLSYGLFGLVVSHGFSLCVLLGPLDVVSIICQSEKITSLANSCSFPDISQPRYLPPTNTYFSLRMSSKRPFFFHAIRGPFKQFCDILFSFCSGFLQNFFVGKHIGSKNPQHCSMNPISNSITNLLNRAAFKIQLSTLERRTDQI